MIAFGNYKEFTVRNLEGSRLTKKRAASGVLNEGSADRHHPTEAELQANRNLNDAGAWAGGWGLCLRTQPG